MQSKKKLCSGCGELHFIWKNKGRDRYCKKCWSAHSAVKIKPTQKPISPRSPKKIKLDAEYSAKRKIFLSKHPMCQAHIPGICTQQSSDVHHMSGRVGSLLLDETKWLSLCRACHMYIELHPEIAKEMGYSIKRIT